MKNIASLLRKDVLFYAEIVTKLVSLQHQKRLYVQVIDSQSHEKINYHHRSLRLFCTIILQS